MIQCSSLRVSQYVGICKTSRPSSTFAPHTLLITRQATEVLKDSASALVFLRQTWRTTDMSHSHCPKCDCPFGQVQHTFHHVLPRRFFPGSDIKISICRKCHDELEKRIPTKQQMPRSFYFLVVNNFLEYQAVKDPDL